MSDILAGLTLTVSLRKQNGQEKKTRKEISADLLHHRLQHDIARTHNKTLPHDTARGLRPFHFDPLDWTPLARLTLIGSQHCPSCDRTTQFIAGDLIRYSQRETVAGVRTVRTRAFSAADTRFAHLPRLLEHLPPEEHTCPTCLSLQDTLEAVFSHSHAVQIPLFGFANPLHHHHQLPQGEKV